jgi:hypothetical protein
MPPRYLLFWALLLLTCGYALVRGRKYERIAAVVFLSATIISVIDHLLLHVRYQSIDVGEVFVDTAVLVSVVAFALVSDRFWPLWVAGLQLVDSMAHVLNAITGDFSPWAYAVAERFWSYPMLIILFIGAWRQNRRSACALATSGGGARVGLSPPGR